MTVVLLGAQPASVSCCIWRAGAGPGSSSQANMSIAVAICHFCPRCCAVLKGWTLLQHPGARAFMRFDRLLPASLLNMLSICCRAKHTSCLTACNTSSCLTACSTRRQEPRTAQPLPDQPHTASHPHSPALPVPP